MEISINYTRPDRDPRGGPVKIGWLITEETPRLYIFRQNGLGQRV